MRIHPVTIGQTPAFVTSTDYFEHEGAEYSV